jgi:glycerol uptake operon antiterminator
MTKMGNNEAFNNVIKNQKVIASFRRIEDAEEIIKHKNIKTIFVLNINIFELKKFVQHSQKNQKNIFVHIDLVDGLGKDAVGIKYLAQAGGIDGVITTKTSLVKAAKEEGLITVQRFFMVDSEAVKTGIKMAKQSKPDAIEILPAFLPKYYVDQIISELGVPVIAGGLARTKEDVQQVLAQGFRAITTSRRNLWDLG